MSNAAAAFDARPTPHDDRDDAAPIELERGVGCMRYLWPPRHLAGCDCPTCDEAADERDERARAAASAALPWDEPSGLPEHGDEDWVDPAAGLRGAA